MCNCKIQLNGKYDPFKFNCECIEDNNWNDYGYIDRFKVVFPNGSRTFIKAITPDLTPDVRGLVSSYTEQVKQAFSKEKASAIIFMGSDFGYYLSLFNFIKKGYITISDYQEFLKANN